MVNVAAEITAKAAHGQVGQRKWSSVNAFTEPDRPAAAVPGMISKSGIRDSHSPMKMRSSVRAR
jgi:hypothetical protein